MNNNIMTYLFLIAGLVVLFTLFSCEKKLVILRNRFKTYLSKF